MNDHCSDSSLTDSLRATWRESDTQSHSSRALPTSRRGERNLSFRLRSEIFAPQSLCLQLLAIGPCACLLSPFPLVSVLRICTRCPPALQRASECCAAWRCGRGWCDAQPHTSPRPPLLRSRCEARKAHSTSVAELAAPLGDTPRPGRRERSSTEELTRELCAQCRCTSASSIIASCTRIQTEKNTAVCD